MIESAEEIAIAFKPPRKSRYPNRALELLWSPAALRYQAACRVASDHPGLRLYPLKRDCQGIGLARPLISQGLYVGGEAAVAGNLQDNVTVLTACYRGGDGDLHAVADRGVACGADLESSVQCRGALLGLRRYAMAHTEGIDRLLRLSDVIRITGTGCNTVYARIKEGTLPKQVKIGPKSVAWRQSEINQWMASLNPSDDQSVH